MYLPKVNTKAFIHHWDSDDWQLVIKCFKGFEEILAEEVRQLGGRDVEILHRAVGCTGDTGFLYKANYSLYTALHVLVNIAQFQAKDADELYRNALKLPWGELMDAEQTFAINFTVHSEAFPHSQYASLRLKDAIVDAVRKHSGKRPSVERRRPDLQFDLMIAGEQVIISLDSSGDPLFKRGYRKRVGRAPLNEVLASGLIKKTGWDGERALYDPFCGSATLLIEACMQHAKLPAGLFRESFGFERWPNYDRELFERIKESRLSRIVEPRMPIMGSDRDAVLIKKAFENLEQAQIADIVDLEVMDFFHSTGQDKSGLIVTNPPYGKKLELPDVAFFERIGDHLKRNYSGWKAWILLPKEVKSIGLRHSGRMEVLNGDLACRWTYYELFSGSKKKQKGGQIN